MIKRILITVFCFVASISYGQGKAISNDKLKNILVQLDSIGDVNRSLVFLRNEMSVWKDISDTDRLVLNEKLARIYIQLLKVDSAFTYINEGLLIAEKLGVDSTLAKYYHAKGVAYYYIGQRKEALQEFEASIGISRKIKFTKQLAATLSNTGAMHVEDKETELAESCLLESIALHNALKLEKSSTNLLANRLLGTLYYNQGEINKAYQIFNRLVELTKETKNLDVQVSAQVYKALSLGKMGRKTEAGACFEEVLGLHKELQDPDSEAATLGYYAVFLEENGNFKKALELQKKAWNLRKASFDKQLANAVSDAEVKYETEVTKNEKIIAELEVERKNSELFISEKKQQKQLWIIATLVAVLTFTFLIAFLILRFRKLKAKQELEKERVNAILTGQERERERIAKDLHDGIVQDLAAIKHKIRLELESLGEVPSLNAVLQDITSAADEVRSISYQLMPLTLREFGLKTSIEALFERTKVIHQIECECTFIEMDERLNEQLEVTIYRVCQELINNAVKHSQTKTLFALFKRNESNIQINFEDNGVGFDELLIKDGIGLNSIRSRVEMIGGTIEKDYAHEQSGTIFYIKLPI